MISIVRRAKCDLVILAIIVSMVTAHEIQASDPTSAVAYGFRHPLLVGNDADPVLRFEIDHASVLPVRLKSIRFTAVEQNGAGAIAEFRVYSGASSDFSKATKVGSIEPNASKYRIPAEIVLPNGKSFLWLTCRVRPGADLTSGVTFSELEIETDQGVIRPDFETGPATFRFGIALRKAGDDGVHTYRIPALTVSKSGTLLCVYDMRRRMGRDLQEDIDIGLSRSVDGGSTWEPVRVIMDMGEYGGLPQELNGCSDP